MVPNFVHLRICDGDRFKLRLWLPLFLAWPIVLIVFLVLLPILVVAELVLRLAHVRIQIFGMLFGLFSLVSATRGLTVKVRSERSIVDVVIR
jgi:hypothetical protein